jgi:hypothetical protein
LLQRRQRRGASETIGFIPLPTICPSPASSIYIYTVSCRHRFHHDSADPMNETIPSISLPPASRKARREVYYYKAAAACLFVCLYVC